MSAQYIIPILELAQNSQTPVHSVARAIHVRCPRGVSLPRCKAKQSKNVRVVIYGLDFTEKPHDLFF